MTHARTSLRLFSCLVLATAASGCALWHGRSAGESDAGFRGALDAAPIGRDAGHAIDAGPCAVGTQFYVPGCATEPGVRITAGCFQPCTGPGDTSCAPGMVCDQTNINPCNCAPGLTCCDVCGADAWLCLPWHSTPVGCEGRDYCSCTGSCVPLIDLTHGCICPCDEPFQCGGPPCDCDCGGATYLGCQFADRCPTPQLHCDLPQHAAVVDGCPACVGL